MSLDISGTNLAGRGAFEADCRNPDAVVGLCDIPVSSPVSTDLWIFSDSIGKLLFQLLKKRMI